ncbi:EAL domain, c-di-GMP-specific phosphodiesterase class I (or its enzymatically inactive variant) [Streptosporangium canum]|uniref:EAL domain, c-di-GMP-specific phosphodiesterase class I (Or its enzymatically inactive variant) n=1 Tax=Streptosporangium canum TaxID=324952 RepID=A0A1I3QQ24_9ACTN|nr:EAL domain, c-di-GMP-specific phosphodiesterase class I (or its enzymatically inactive variant) [Streptosporangium canum]
MRLLRVVHPLYVASRTHLLPASAAANVDITPIVDLDTGGVIALQAIGDHHGNVASLAGTLLGAARNETLLPLVLGLPAEAVIGGSAALAPLHEALRVTGRRPREVILMLRGGFSQAERRALITGLDGLRAIGYLIAVGDLGTGHIPMDLLTDAAPYLAALSPELMARIPRDPRRAALAEGLARLAREVGAHVLAPGVTEEAQLAAARGWGVRLAQGPLLVPGPSGRVHVPLPILAQEPVQALLGPRVQEFLLPAVTLPCEATAEDAVGAFGSEPSITSVILVDEYQRPKGSLDRSRFLLSIAGRFGHALHGKKPAGRLADSARTVPKTTPAIAAMQVAGRDAERVYDDLVVVDEVGRCMGIVRVSDLIRQVAAAR